MEWAAATTPTGAGINATDVSVYDVMDDVDDAENERVNDSFKKVTNFSSILFGREYHLLLPILA